MDSSPFGCLVPRSSQSLGSSASGLRQQAGSSGEHLHEVSRDSGIQGHRTAAVKWHRRLLPVSLAH